VWQNGMMVFLLDELLGGASRMTNNFPDLMSSPALVVSVLYAVGCITPHALEENH